MKKIFWPTVLSIGIFLALLPEARADVVMQLVGTPSDNYAGIYLSPYSLSVDKVPMLLTCDDFVHDVSVGDTWAAAVILGTSGNLLSTQMAKAAKAAGLIQDEAGAEALYDAKAWIELNKLYTASDRYSRAVASYAIWDLFQPTAVGNYLSGPTYATFRTDIAAMVADAKAKGTGLHRNVTIYSPTAAIFQGPHRGHFAQEFDYTRVPEGGMSLMLLGAALAGIESFRRKLCS